MATRQARIQTAITHLRLADPVMRGMIDRVGDYTLRLERDRFRMLVRSILSQQISVGAARSIRERLEKLAEPEGLTASNLRRFSVEALRSAGVSPQKAGYIRDLADKVDCSAVELRNIGRLSDERVIEELTKIKGIGRWTAQMFLIFSLGRLDVFPHDDLGVRASIRTQYALDDLPDKTVSCQIAAAWSPYASVASWYCWRSLELTRRAKSDGADYPS